MALMDEVERRRFLETLRNDADFRAAVRRELLTEELLNLPHALATLVDVVAQQRQDFTALAADVRTYMERTITLLGEGFTAVRSGFDQVDAELSELRTDVTELRTDITELRTDVTELRTGLSELRTDVGAGFTAVDARFDQIDAEIRAINDKLAS